MTIRNWLLIFALGIGWGGSFYFNDLLLREVGPLTVSAGRVSLGAIGCWVYVFSTGRKVRMPALVLGQMLFLGILQFALPFAIFPISQQYIASGAAGIINALTPLMVVIVSHFWAGGEKATVTKTTGVVFGFGGISFLALPALKSGGGSEFWGLILAVMAPVCYAVALNYVRRFKGSDTSVLVAVSLTGATLFILPLSVAVEGIPVVTQSETILAFGVVGFGLTSVSFLLIYWLLPQVGATNASTVTFIAPISAVLLGVLMLDESFSTSHFCGMAAILAGLLLIDGRLTKLLGRIFTMRRQKLANV